MKKTTEITIVQAQITHVQECLPILIDSILGTYFEPDLALSRLTEGQSKRELFVAILGEKVVGFYQMATNGVFLVFPYLHLLAVKTSERGYGIGGKLLAHFETLNFEAEGYPFRPKVFLLVSDHNPDAIRFYERHGYTNKAYFDDMFGEGDTEFLMMKDLGIKKGSNF